MKEDVLDVLMYLFENYMDDDVAIEADPEILKSQLREAGFLSTEINKAFTWLEDLSVLQEGSRVNWQYHIAARYLTYYITY